jgi:type VI secretion system FHA domain protein
MTLTLEVTGPQATTLGAASRKVFDASGGTIGRLADNTWSLPDPYVSSRHAVIRYRDGVYYIEDTSTNGVFINSPDSQLIKGQPRALKSGDWIFIEPYEIRVSIASDTPRAAASPFDDLFGPASSAVPSSSPPPISGDAFAAPLAEPQQPRVPSSLSPLPEPIAGSEEVDPLNLLGLAPGRPPQQAPSASDLARSSVLSDHYQAPQSIPAAPAPPAPPSHGGLIPDDYNPLGPDRATNLPPPAPPVRAVPGLPERLGGVPLPPPPNPVPEPPRPIPRRAPAPPVPAPPPVARPEIKRETPRAEGDLAAVLAGAGLDQVAVTPELAHSFGQILRIVVGGVMDVLQSRQRIKSEFRMGMTTFKPADNNPLKFSANVDDALHNLLVKRNAAYLGPVDAFEDAFDDLRHHQMAMLAGVRVAFEMMLAEFDPDRLQAEFDQQLKKGALLSVPARLRYWDLYRDKFHDMVKDPETSFRELFGEEFAKAYEEQLRRLKAQGRADKG